MRIVFIGTVEFSKKALEKLIDLKADIAGVITKKRSRFNADFADLSGVCAQNNIPCKYVSDINTGDNLEWIKQLDPEIIFCFGISQILNTDILKAAPKGVIGYHPAKLPLNRGRHPIIWALALGLDKTASTFFFMDEGVDSGDLLSQVDINITYVDNARTLYDKITSAAMIQVEEFLPELEDNSFKKIPQDNSQANYWRRRTKADGQIDFRMSSRSVYNLVRALTKPYLGAHVLYKGEEVKVWEAQEIDAGGKNSEYGKVLDLADKKIIVKCSDKAVILTRHEFKKIPAIGGYLL